MRFSRRLGALAACVGLAACSVTTNPNPATMPAATPSAVTPAASDEIVLGGARPVTVRLPAGGDSAPAPLLVMLHGLASSGAEHEAYFRFGPVAARDGFVYAHPDGTIDSQGNRFWNATDACCDFDPKGVDDATYLEEVISEIGEAVRIDSKRVYIVGHSNGGFMSYRMACEHADLVAGIVSLAGATYATRTDCRPSEPVAILEIHGTADDVVRFEGGTLTDIGAPGAMASYPGAKETVASWAAYDGCAPALVESPTTVDVDAAINGSKGPAETTVETATGCDRGGHVELWTIPTGGHGPDLSGTFAESVLAFLLAHPKP